AVRTGEGRPLVVPLPPPPGLRAVVLTPDRAISTHHSRAALPATVPHADAAYTVGRASLLVASLLTGRHDLPGAALDDRFHQPHHPRQRAPGQRHRPVDGQETPAETLDEVLREPGL